ncbi:MAG TPA: DinB family protein [Anaerolineales bacterium]
MATLTTAALIDSIAVLLTEAYAGPPNPSSTWFIDNEPDSGILGILAGVSAAEASRPMDRIGNPGSTIAAHAEHLRWSLAQGNAALRGEPFQENWKESWRLIQADPAEWDRLRAELRADFEALREAIRGQSDLSGDDLTGVLALLPHAAYHLGNIRQMIERVREFSDEAPG